MKIYIASDLHGSYKGAKKFFDIFDSAKASGEDAYAVLLGDIYNHGPRNPLPEEYAPMSVAKLLNDHADSISVIKGNCDSEVDQMISEFEFVQNLDMLFSSHRVLFTHGHKCSVYMPKMYGRSGDIVFYGHFHKPQIECKDGVIYVCVGAIGISPEGVEKSYAVLDEKGVEIHSLYTNEVIATYMF